MTEQAINLSPKALSALANLKGVASENGKNRTLSVH